MAATKQIPGSDVTDSQEQTTVDSFCDELESTIDRFRGQGLGFAECVGCLELVKADIINEMLEE